MGPGTVRIELDKSQNQISSEGRLSLFVSFFADDGILNVG
jgi:hypothetical protein